MSSERELKSQVIRALDDVLAPAPWLEAAVTKQLRQRRSESWLERIRRTPTQMRVAVAGLTMVLLAATLAIALLLTQMYAPRPIPSGHSFLTPVEQRQLALLEARPLQLPPMPASGQCPTTPYSLVHPFRVGSDSTWFNGSGPVYLATGGVAIDGGRYWEVTFYTAPTVRGVVLIRGVFLRDRSSQVFVGTWATGPVVGTDTVEGKRLDLHTEVAVPADRPPSNVLAAPDWGFWSTRWGGGRCLGIQVDSAAGTEILVID